MCGRSAGLSQGSGVLLQAHCEIVLSGTNVTRLKTNLLNGNACKKFLQSPVAAELTKVAKEMKAALLVYTPKASSSKRSLTSSCAVER